MDVPFQSIQLQVFQRILDLALTLIQEQILVVAEVFLAAIFRMNPFFLQINIVQCELNKRINFREMLIFVFQQHRSQVDSVAFVGDPDIFQDLRK